MATGSNKANVELKLSRVRLAFPSLHEKDRFGRYSAAFIVTPKDDNYNAIVAAVNKVATLKWGERAGAQLKGLKAKDKICLHDGDNKPDVSGYPGNFYLSGSARVRPTLLLRDRSQATAEDDALYAGCYVNAIVDIWAQDDKAKGYIGINCSIRGVQHAAHGERFSGGGIAKADEFEDLGEDDGGGSDLVGEGSGDFDDDIPF